jgi:predicted MFS family arabinose efflux permease
MADGHRVLAFILFGFIYLGFALACRRLHIWLLFMAYGIFMAMTEGVQKAFLATLVPPQFKATGFGLYNSLIGLAALPASLIAGFLWDRFGPRSTFLYGTVMAWISALLFIYLLLKRKRQ